MYNIYILYIIYIIYNINNINIIYIYIYVYIYIYIMIRCPTFYSYSNFNIKEVNLLIFESINSEFDVFMKII